MLSGLYDRLRQILASDFPSEAEGSINNQLSEITKEYDNILDQYQENHSIIDLDTFKVQHNEEFHIKFCGRVLIQFRSWINTFLPYLILIVIPPIVITILLILP